MGVWKTNLSRFTAVVALSSLLSLSSGQSPRIAMTFWINGDSACSAGDAWERTGPIPLSKCSPTLDQQYFVKMAQTKLPGTVSGSVYIDAQCQTIASGFEVASFTLDGTCRGPLFGRGIYFVGSFEGSASQSRAPSVSQTPPPQGQQVSLQLYTQPDCTGALLGGTFVPDACEVASTGNVYGQFSIPSAGEVYGGWFIDALCTQAVYYIKTRLYTADGACLGPVGTNGVALYYVGQVLEMSTSDVQRVALPERLACSDALAECLPVEHSLAHRLSGLRAQSLAFSVGERQQCRLSVGERQPRPLSVGERQPHQQLHALRSAGGDHIAERLEWPSRALLLDRRRVGDGRAHPGLLLAHVYRRFLLAHASGGGQPGQRQRRLVCG